MVGLLPYLLGQLRFDSSDTRDGFFVGRAHKGEMEEISYPFYFCKQIAASDVSLYICM